MTHGAAGLELLVGEVAELPWTVLGPGLLALGVAVALFRRSRRRPRVGEIWFAQVPFEDGTGSKDRPVLVLAVQGRTVAVARFTSRHKGGRRDHVRVPDGMPGLSRASWVSTRPVRLSRSAMRRRSGMPGPALVEWYDEVTGRATAG